MNNKVIDWEAALEQCGDDEDFLREILGDLRSEVNSQMTVLAENIYVSECLILEITFLRKEASVKLEYFPDNTECRVIKHLLTESSGPPMSLKGQHQI